MSKVKFYQYPKCSTCRKAQKFLENNGIEFQNINIVETPPKKTELKKMLDSYDGEIKRLFNTSGVQYRELKIKDKIKDMSQKEAFDLLSSNGKLVKRPFLLSDSENLVGFKEDEWSQLK